MAAHIAAQLPADLRPTDYEYAFLSNLVYDVLDPTDRRTRSFRIDMQTWTVIHTRSGRRGFYAAIFENIATRHLVAAFRGTNSLPSLLL